MKRVESTHTQKINYIFACNHQSNKSLKSLNISIKKTKMSISQAVTKKQEKNVCRKAKPFLAS